jgi:hypothetical protein
MGFFFFFHFYQVGGLAILHKKNDPSLARGQRVNYFAFRILHSSGDPIRIHCLNMAIYGFRVFTQNMVTFAALFFSPKQALVQFGGFFFSPQCKNCWAHKKTSKPPPIPPQKIGPPKKNSRPTPSS